MLHAHRRCSTTRDMAPDCPSDPEAMASHQRGQEKKRTGVHAMLPCFPRSNNRNRNRLQAQVASPHPPAVCDLGKVCRSNFSASSIRRASLDVPERPALRGARQRRTPAPMSARRCRHRPGPLPSRSARPTILSPDALEGRQRRKRRFSRPRRAGARCPNRDLAMPREPPSGHSVANDVFYRSSNRLARRMAEKAGQKKAQRKSDM